MRQIDDGKLNWDGIKTFFSKRTRRILPPLLLMMSIMLPLSFFLVDHAVFMLTALHTTTSALFIQNFMLAWQGNFLDKMTAILVHMWSLSVEEQFYIVMPLLLIFAPRRHFRYLFPALWIVSFGINIWQMTPADITQNYLTTTGRAWQLLTGSILAVWNADGYPSAIKSMSRFPPRSYLALVGLLMIGYSDLYFTQTWAYPGYFGLIPVLGSALIICSASDKRIVSMFLCCRFMVWTGGISYSIYLWSYSLTGLTYNHYGVHYLVVDLMIFPASFYVAWLSTETVERYFRNPNEAKKKVMLALIWLLSLAIIGLVITII